MRRRAGLSADSGRAGRVVASRRRIAAAVRRLAREITDCHKDRELTILAVMAGSLVFLADLIRRLPMRTRIELAGATSYRNGSAGPTRLRLSMPARMDLAGKHVLIVDDILDTGGTLKALAGRVRRMKPAGLKICVLLRKAVERPGGLPEADFVGIDIPDVFVIGYGLDCDGVHRNLPDIHELREKRRPM